MKRLFVLFIALFILCSPSFGEEYPQKDILDGEVIELENANTDTLLENSIQKDKGNGKEPLKAKVSEYFELKNGVPYIHYKDYLRFDFGAIGAINWNMSSSDNNNLHTNFAFDSIDLVLSGKANDYISYKAQVLPHRNIDKITILGDLWVKGAYKNYSLQLGRMRRPFGHEPARSGYDIDTANFSQISRLLVDQRDTGGKLSAKYKYMDVDLGLFASMQKRPFDFSSHGIEFDSTITLKPLAKWEDKGNLKIAGSIATGSRDYSFTHYGGFVSYDYKRWGMKTEYICKEPVFYGEKKADGLYVDGTYFITDKLQALLRFDTFNPDVNHSSRRTNEYTAGLTYFLNGNNTMVVLNYTFIDGTSKSQRIALEMIYRTW